MSEELIAYTDFCGENPEPQTFDLFYSGLAGTLQVHGIYELGDDDLFIRAVDRSAYEEKCVSIAKLFARLAKNTSKMMTAEDKLAYTERHLVNIANGVGNAQEYAFGVLEGLKLKRLGDGA